MCVCVCRLMLYPLCFSSHAGMKTCKFTTGNARICDDITTQNSCDKYCGGYGTGIVTDPKSETCKVKTDLKPHNNHFYFIKDWANCNIGAVLKHTAQIVGRPRSNGVPLYGLTLKCTCKTSSKDIGKSLPSLTHSFTHSLLLHPHSSLAELLTHVRTLH